MTAGSLRRVTLAVSSILFILLLRTGAPCQSATAQVGGAVADEAGRAYAGFWQMWSQADPQLSELREALDYVEKAGVG